MTSYLRVSGTKNIHGDGNEIMLRGAGLGGWMNMENFISGESLVKYRPTPSPDLNNLFGVSRMYASKGFFPDEAKLRRDVLEAFFQGAGAAFFAGLGLNCIRLPFNYRHFEGTNRPSNPRVLKKEGFKHHDRVIDLCAKHDIYTILDLHAAPGGKNTDWHSDHGEHIANFWNHKDHQDRAVWLWEKLATHYKVNKWIAGYNPLNEPTEPKHIRLVEYYDPLSDAIRKIDAHHILFLDGNTFASGFTHFSGGYVKKRENTSHSIHDYSRFWFPGSEPYDGSGSRVRHLTGAYEEKREWLDKRGLCVWNGEWGPVYARKEYEGDATDAINNSRICLLKDQLAIYNRVRAQDRLSWYIWLYKDIGFQGMVYVSPETPYMTLFKDFLARKHLRQIYQPLVNHILEEIPEQHQHLYPWPVWKLADRISRLSRNILIAEFLIQEWADRFKGRTKEEIRDLAWSFSFENCLHRDILNKVLKENTTQPD